MNIALPALPAACPAGDCAPPLPLPNGACTRQQPLVSINNTTNGAPIAPPAPNLGVSQGFQANKNDPSLNLGVGAYRTEELQPYVLSVLNKECLYLNLCQCKAGGRQGLQNGIWTAVN